MLKGDVFAEQLFENQIFALFINTFLNGHNGVASGYKNSMAMTYSGKKITIKEGAVCIQGRFMHNDADEEISVNETNKFHKLIIEIDLDKVNTPSTLNQAYFKIITGNSNYPSLTQTDIVNNVTGVYQYELARFKTNASGNITDFADKREFLDFTSIYTAIENTLAAMESDFEGDAQALITNLQAEIAGVEDSSEFIMKSQIVTLSKAVTPTQSGGKYYANATFNLPGGWTFERTCILKVEAQIDTGGVGTYTRITSNYTSADGDAPQTTLSLANVEVTSDTTGIKITIIRV